MGEIGIGLIGEWVGGWVDKYVNEWMVGLIDE